MVEHVHVEYSRTASCGRLLHISVKMEPGQMEALWLLLAGGSEKVREERSRLSDWTYGT